MLNHSPDPAWLSQMKKYAGQSCPTGQPVPPLIRRAFDHTSWKLKEGDKTPASCAAGLCMVFEEVGLTGTYSAAAESFAHWGVPSALKKGAVVVFQWAAGDHHVTLCAEDPTDEKTVVCFGFNQGHKVQTAVYSQRWILAVRWPNVSA